MRIIKLIRLALVLTTAIVTFSCLKEKKQHVAYDRLGKCNSTDLDSTTLCGTLSVFENRQTNTGRKIDLNIIVIPAIHKNQSKAPIFVLEGGPGVSAAIGASFYVDSVNYYREDHDVVLIDVRGTGLSNPLHCRQLQFKENLEQRLDEMYPVSAVKECYDSLSMLADLTQYTTTNMAVDMEEVRKWLGYDKISLYGLSFGTRLAQVYMKMFPDAVESTVLWSPTTTYSKLPLYHAPFAEESMSKLVNDCKKDSLCHLTFPNFDEEFKDLLNRGSGKPFEYKQKQADGKIVTIKIPWHAFNSKIRALMYMPAGLRKIPYLIHQSYLGNWQPFIALYPANASFDDFIADGLYLCVTCTEDVPFITSRELDSLTSNTFVGDYRVKQQQQACDHWTRGTVPDDYFEPLVSQIPTLVFSGYFDPVTPPSMAQQIVQTLPNSFLISIPTMSHTFDGLSNPECFDKIAIDFLNDPHTRPGSECTSQMLPDKYKIQ
jgi:pimeloyl-ACP methyl ester carboxylesterase